MTSQQQEAWDRLWSEFEQLRAAISRSEAVNVNATSLRDRAQQLVQLYFREARPEQLRLGISEDELARADQEMQRLLELSHGRNAKTSYIGVLRNLARERTPLSALREKRLGEVVTLPAEGTRGYGQTEAHILTTLKAMLSDAAASYEQAILDLRGGSRVSWRSTAVELREVVRETLDHLAPDDAVMKEPNFKFEKDRKGPTMRQKASFVFRSRGLSESKRKTPQEAVSLVDALTAAFVRSIYERGSGSTHGAPSKGDVDKLKMYVDIALVELLETSRPPA